MLKETEKTAWIVDGAYANKIAQAHSIKLDYKLLKKLMSDHVGGRLHESYFITATSGALPESVQRFYNFIQSAEPAGPHMRVELYGLKRVLHQCSDCSKTCEKLVQRGVDVAIATRMIEAANRCNRIILFLGDGDFAEAIRFVKRLCGKEVIIAGFRGSVATDIQSLADEVIWLNDYVSQIRRQTA